MKLFHLLALSGACAALSQGHEVEIDLLKEEPNILLEETDTLRKDPQFILVDPEIVPHDPELYDNVEEVPAVADRDLLFGFRGKSRLKAKASIPAEAPGVFQLHYFGSTSTKIREIFGNVSKKLDSLIISRPSFKLKKKLKVRDLCTKKLIPSSFVLERMRFHSIQLFIGEGISDGKGGRLASTRSCLSYVGTDRLRRNAVAAIFYDPADINDQTNDTRIEQIILHEAIHALGFGSNWRSFLTKKSGSPYYAGKNAVKEYRKLLPEDDERKKKGLIPVEDAPSKGAYGSHWRTSVFGDEIMTAVFRGGKHIFSNLTAKAIEDLGFRINHNSTFIKPYTIPTAEEMENLLNGRGRNSHLRRSESDKT